MKKRAMREEINRNVAQIRANFAELKRSTEEGAQSMRAAGAKFNRVADRADRHLDRLRRGEDEDTGRIDLLPFQRHR